MPKKIKPFVAPPELRCAIEQVGKVYESRAGSLLFRRGENNKGLFLVLSGRVALSSGEDPTRIVRIAERGSLLGLPATVSGIPYSLTAEVVADSQLSMISRSKFQNLLLSNSAFGLTVLRMLADEVSVLRQLTVYSASRRWRSKILASML